jgi:hypothetical protein
LPQIWLQGVRKNVVNRATILLKLCFDIGNVFPMNFRFANHRLSPMTHCRGHLQPSANLDGVTRCWPVYMEVTPTKIRSSFNLVRVKVFIFFCCPNIVICSFNVLMNPLGVVDLRFQVYVTLKLLMLRLGVPKPLSDFA